MQLTTENVHNTFMDCLYKEGEDTTGHILADGIMIRAGFNPYRLGKNKDNITAMLEDLPEYFYQGKGDGGSFLNLCLNKAERQWCDLHSVMDELLMLGLAIGKIEYNLPRTLWGIFPSGMPYLKIK